MAERPHFMDRLTQLEPNGGCERDNEASEVGQLVFYPKCLQCEWNNEAFTAVEAIAQAERHIADTEHRPVRISFDTLGNFLMNVE